MATESTTRLNQNTTQGDQFAVIQDDSGFKHQEVVIQTQTGSSNPTTVNPTNPLPIQGNVGSGVTDAGFPVAIAGVYNTSPPTVTTGQRVAVQTDANGFIKVNIAAGAAAGGTSSNFGSSFPGPGTAIGFKDSAGTNMQPGNLDAAGNLKVNVASGSVQAVVDNVTAFTGGSSQGLPIAFVYNDSAGAAVSGDFALPRITANRQQRVVIDADNTASGGLTPYSAIAPATPAKVAVKASAGKIHFMNCTNISGAVAYLKLFDLASGSVTLGTTAASYQFAIPANALGAGFNISIPQGLSFVNAITIAITGAIATTDNTSITASSVIANIGYA